MSPAEQRRQPSGGAYVPLSPEEVRNLSQSLPDWTLKDNSIEKLFQFRDFRRAIEFVRNVADAAESANHHPDIFISYNRVKLTLTTRKIGALTKMDFDLAAEIDLLPTD
jgi:4a-hydroxytetrahydrobiopterin dehydratase